MLNFKNDRREPYSAEKLDSMMFSGKKSLRNYYLENSYGKLGISGDVFGWVNLQSESGDGCGLRVGIFYVRNKYEEWSVNADKILEDSGVDLDE